MTGRNSGSATSDAPRRARTPDGPARSAGADSPPGRAGSSPPGRVGRIAERAFSKRASGGPPPRPSSRGRRRSRPARAAPATLRRWPEARPGAQWRRPATAREAPPPPSNPRLGNSSNGPPRAREPLPSWLGRTFGGQNKEGPLEEDGRRLPPESQRIFDS